MYQFDKFFSMRGMTAEQNVSYKTLIGRIREAREMHEAYVEAIY